MESVDWHKYFMDIAVAVSVKSKDPNTKVGSVIVDGNNRIISTGYNGFPAGMVENDYLWSKENKKKFVCHSELNAILYAKVDLSGCTLYTTLSPCNECAKVIAASKIKQVFYGELKNNEITNEIFKLCGIVMEKVTCV
jgi:dCMP deaminase